VPHGRLTVPNLDGPQVLKQGFTICIMTACGGREERMPRWLNRVVGRIRWMAAAGRVRLTMKAESEIATLGAPFDPDECLLVLSHLKPHEFVQRVWSAQRLEWLYVFRPCVHGVTLYVKIALRNRCHVVSFHAEESDHVE
jgi:hypothetical protein